MKILILITLACSVLFATNSPGQQISTLTDQDMGMVTGADPCYGSCYTDNLPCADGMSMPTTCATVPYPPYGVRCSVGSPNFYVFSQYYLEGDCWIDFTNLYAICNLTTTYGCKDWKKYLCWEQFYWALNIQTGQRYLVRSNCASVAAPDFYIENVQTGFRREVLPGSSSCGTL